MSAEYSTKESALLTEMFYAGRADLYKDKEFEDVLKNPEIKIIDKSISQFGYTHESVMALEFKNSKGVLVQICTTLFRSGFDLWIIDPESGMAMRT